MRLHPVGRPVSESRAVPVIVLPRHLPAPIRFTWSCHCCDFRASAFGERQLAAAMDAHADFVNLTKDRATDPHFTDARLSALVAR
jgi:hypothetical protein